MDTINFSETKESDYFFYWDELKDRNEMEEIIKNVDKPTECYLAHLREPYFNLMSLLEDYIWSEFDDAYYSLIVDGLKPLVEKFNKEIISVLKIYPYYESTLTLVNLEK